MHFLFFETSISKISYLIFYFANKRTPWIQIHRMLKNNIWYGKWKDYQLISLIIRLYWRVRNLYLIYKNSKMKFQNLINRVWEKSNSSLLFLYSKSYWIAVKIITKLHDLFFQPASVKFLIYDSTSKTKAPALILNELFILC